MNKNREQAICHEAKARVHMLYAERDGETINKAECVEAARTNRILADYYWEEAQK